MNDKMLIGPKPVQFPVQRDLTILKILSSFNNNFGDLIAPCAVPITSWNVFSQIFCIPSFSFLKAAAHLDISPGHHNISSQKSIFRYSRPSNCHNLRHHDIPSSDILPPRRKGTPSLHTTTTTIHPLLLSIVSRLEQNRLPRRRPRPWRCAKRQSQRQPSLHRSRRLPFLWRQRCRAHSPRIRTEQSRLLHASDRLARRERSRYYLGRLEGHGESRSGSCGSG